MQSNYIFMNKMKYKKIKYSFLKKYVTNIIRCFNDEKNLFVIDNSQLFT